MKISDDSKNQLANVTGTMHDIADMIADKDLNLETLIVMLEAIDILATVVKTYIDISTLENQPE